MKLEAWLRMADIAYSIAPLDMSKAPKGKVPFIEHEGKCIGDSTLIIERLSAERNIDLDRGLSAQERAISLAFRRMLKENTYWIITAIRYMVEEHWQLYRELCAAALTPGLPREQWEPIMEGWRNTIVDGLKGHGLGRHTIGEIYDIGIADITALSDFLADKPFFMGDHPTTLDATAYAYLGNLIKPPYPNPVTAHALQQGNLVRFYDRMDQRLFGDL